MLLNHAIGAGWGTEGFYISFNADLSNPAGWSEPQRLPIEPDGPAQAYPQVIGLDNDSTDTKAGQLVRLFLSGESRWELIFGQPMAIPARPADKPNYIPQRDGISQSYSFIQPASATAGSVAPARIDKAVATRPRR
jgi:hypothetical protein